MSARGRQTANVFTRPRLAGIAAVLAAAALGALQLIHPAANIAKPPTPTGGVLALNTGPAATTPTPAPSSSGSTTSTTPSPSSPASAPGAAAPATSTHSSTAQQPSGPASCATAKRQASLQLTAANYTETQTLSATTSAQYAGTCTLNNAATAVVTNSSGATVNTQSFNGTVSGQTLSATVTWNLHGVAPGNYTFTVNWPGLVVSQKFTVVECLNSDFTASISMPTSASTGSDVTVDGSVKNNSADTCTFAEATSLIIKDSSGNIVFGTGLGSTNNQQVWNPGQTVTYPYHYTWPAHSAGHYTVTLVDNTHNLTAGPLPIDIT